MGDKKEKKREAELKARLSKFKRAKKKLMSQVRSNRMFSVGLGIGGGGGNAAFLNALNQGTMGGGKAGSIADAKNKPKPITSTANISQGGDFSWPGENNGGGNDKVDGEREATKVKNDEEERHSESETDTGTDTDGSHTDDEHSGSE